MRSKKRESNRLLKHSLTRYKSLNSLMKNIYYVNQNNNDFIEESIIIEDILNLFIIKKKVVDAQDFFINDILRINNKNLFEKLISVLYGLKRKHFENIDIIRFLQNLLYNLLLSEFGKEKEFDRKLNTSGLYLREFLDIRYLEKFKESNDSDWLEKHKALIDNTVDTISGLCKFIISTTQLETDIKKMYLESQLSELNKSLKHYETLNKYDFSKENYSNIKLDTIKERKSSLQKHKLNLLFFILYNIEEDKLSKEFFEIVLKLYKSGNLTSELNETQDTLSSFDLDFLNYDWFKGGAQGIPRFNYNKYSLLILFYNYLESGKKETGIKNLVKEYFTNTSTDLEREIKNLNMEFVKKYFIFNEIDLKNFKKVALSDIAKKKKEVKELENKYIIKSKIKDEYVKKFRDDCTNRWEEKQKALLKIFNIKKVKNDDKKLFFGQHTLFPKEWFLEPFDSNVGLARTSSEDFGRTQAESKYRKILEDINSQFDKEKRDKEIKVKDLYADLSNNITSNKTYYLFYTGREIYNLPNIEWLREDIFVAKLKIKNSDIYLCYSRIPEILLIEKDAFNLKQFLNNQGEELTIEINENFTEDEIKKILEFSKSLKTKEDVLKNVKIKVLEKFEVERKEGNNIIRLNIKNKD